MRSILEPFKVGDQLTYAPSMLTPHKPTMSSKLNKVAELFELDVLSEDETLKACSLIIGQHTKSKTGNYSKSEIEGIKEKIQSVSNQN